MLLRKGVLVLAFEGQIMEWDRGSFREPFQGETACNMQVRPHSIRVYEASLERTPPEVHIFVGHTTQVFHRRPSAMCWGNELLQAYRARRRGGVIVVTLHVCHRYCAYTQPLLGSF